MGLSQAKYIKGNLFTADIVYYVVLHLKSDQLALSNVCAIK